MRVTSRCSFLAWLMASSAFSEILPPVTPKMAPPTSRPTPSVAAPSTALPSAIPPPPAASAPPPKAASVALVAATPVRDAIAVPVDAVPNAITAAVVAPAAAKPPAVPTAAPPRPPSSTPAPMETCFSSSALYCGRLTSPIWHSLKSGRFWIFSIISENFSKLLRISISLLPRRSMTSFASSLFFLNLFWLSSCISCAASLVFLASLIFAAPLTPRPTPLIPAAIAPIPKIIGNGIL